VDLRTSRPRAEWRERVIPFAAADDGRPATIVAVAESFLWECRHRLRAYQP